MDNQVILEAKKRVFIEAIQDACDVLHLAMPKINFSGDDDPGGNELAHSHPGSYKICISERQLKLQKSTGLKETANHEMTHLIGLIQHDSKFEKVKGELILEGWKPPKDSGVQFVSKNRVNEQSRKIRGNTKEYAKINEDSDLVKFLDSKSQNWRTYKENVHYTKPKSKGRNVTDKNKSVIEKGNNKTDYSRMTEAEIEESRIKSGIVTEKVPSKSSFSEEGICQRNSCDKKSIGRCKYCNKMFCEEHIGPIIVMSPKDAWNLTGLRESDPIKYKKYATDWNRIDGHPCPAYTGVWNKKHEKELINNEGIMRSIPKGSEGLTDSNIKNGAVSEKTRHIAGPVLIFIAIVILVFSYNAYITGYNKTISTSNFTFLFSGIFWDLVGILIGAVLIAIGLILAYPKGARWLANRNGNRK
ncbi:MAG: hypothetical protein M1128_02510 [Candidatus Marsarchaeota archaeon]|nr:hypothetical protein [Candidatus Marsarchaeota archaeon]